MLTVWLLLVVMVMVIDLCLCLLLTGWRLGGARGETGVCLLLPWVR